MNRRGFFRGMLAAAVLGTTKAYIPDLAPKYRIVMHPGTMWCPYLPEDFRSLAKGDRLVATLLANQANHMAGYTHIQPYGLENLVTTTKISP